MCIKMQQIPISKLYVAIEVLENGWHQVVAIENSMYSALGKLLVYLMESENGKTTFSMPYKMEDGESICVDRADSKDYWCVMPYRDGRYDLMITRRARQ